MSDVRPRELVKRTGFYALGVVIMTFGIAMSIRAGIGVAPGSAVPYAVSRICPLSIGQCSTLFHIFCVLLQLALSRRITLQVVLQFPMAYVFGLLIDLFHMLLDIAPANMLYSIILLVAGLVIFSLGIRIIVGADLLLAPPDGLARTLGNFFGLPMSKSKLFFDIIVTVIAAVLTLIVAGNAFIAVGIGTVICAIGTGPAIGLYTKLFPFFDIPGKRE